ncbi:hypothetical protein DF3PA_350018 [Candidatus Defluviicoccus seviourii]|uniref:HTH merR-type domain-containing protein n=2 Tax=root TaxID=1 RepID=A0A564WF42_9PROT|nr:hypothetical protein DF3PB_80036 [uncultured Defluviicoccus sp.]VUX47086.1 hypothetical protein DF3PA_350018 [Candidatus Defluviicoccus seviourii]
MIEGVSIHVFAQLMGVSRPAVRRWLRLGYIALRPDGTIDAAAAEAALAAWGLPRHRFETGGAGGEYRVSLAEIMAAPFSAAAQAVIDEVAAIDVDALLWPADDR